MSANESKPKWKRTLLLAFRIYAGFCTLLLTAYFALAIWSSFLAQTLPGSEEITLKSAYGSYMANEYPKRGDGFNALAGALGWRSKAVAVSRADVLKYLGKPDFVQGNADTVTLLYAYYPSGRTDQWEVYAFLKEGKLAQVGFNGAAANDHSGYRPYSGEAAPNQQGGANVRQPSSSETNRSPAAASTRRSP